MKTPLLSLHLWEGKWEKEQTQQNTPKTVVFLSTLWKPLMPSPRRLPSLLSPILQFWIPRVNWLNLALFLLLSWTSGADLLGWGLYLWSATTSRSKGECTEEYSVYYIYLLKRLMKHFQLPIVKINITWIIHK